jgi:histone acetyltransferase (RNA polymerase elongator complex component)
VFLQPQNQRINANYYQFKTNVKYEHINISNSTETKFLGLHINKALLWSQHGDHIATKLCSACCALRNVKHIAPQSTLRTIYYAYIHSILNYGIILLGRSSIINKLFVLQKKIVRIITNTGVRESFKKYGYYDDVFPIHFLTNSVCS